MLHVTMTSVLRKSKNTLAVHVGYYLKLEVCRQIHGRFNCNLR